MPTPAAGRLPAAFLLVVEVLVLSVPWARASWVAWVNMHAGSRGWPSVYMAIILKSGCSCVQPLTKIPKLPCDSRRVMCSDEDTAMKRVKHLPYKLKMSLWRYGNGSCTRLDACMYVWGVRFVCACVRVFLSKAESLKRLLLSPPSNIVRRGHRQTKEGDLS